MLFFLFQSPESMPYITSANPAAACAFYKLAEQHPHALIPSKRFGGRPLPVCYQGAPAVGGLCLKHPGRCHMTERRSKAALWFAPLAFKGKLCLQGCSLLAKEHRSVFWPVVGCLIFFHLRSPSLRVAYAQQFCCFFYYAFSFV